MDYERNSECWYKDVCQESSCNSCIRFLEMKHLMDSSGIPKIRQYPTTLIPEKVDYNVFCELADIKDNIVSWVNGSTNIYICSRQTGNGKTSWAIKLLLKYFDQIWPGNGFRNRGLFIHVPTLLLQLKNFQSPTSEQYKFDILNDDFVIFDDIAATTISNYDMDNLMMYIDARILQEKFTVFTSNKTTKESLSQAVGERLASRIRETSKLIELRGKDRRHGKSANNQ